VGITTERHKLAPQIGFKALGRTPRLERHAIVDLALAQASSVLFRLEKLPDSSIPTCGQLYFSFIGTPYRVHDLELVNLFRICVGSPNVITVVFDGLNSKCHLKL
jgi:hypothetical protein